MTILFLIKPEKKLNKKRHIIRAGANFNPTTFLIHQAFIFLKKKLILFVAEKTGLKKFVYFRQ